MSDSQRLISRYLMRLDPVTQTGYRLHFLRIEREDESAIHMLREALSKSVNDSQNPVLRELLEEIPKDPNYNKVRFGQHVTKKKKKGILIDEDDDDDVNDTPIPARNQPPAEDIPQASKLLTNYELEDSLKLFEKIRLDKQSNSRVEKFFRERIVINLLLENYREALLIAQKAIAVNDPKANYPIMAFVAAIAAGEFYIAKEYLSSVISEIKINPQDGQSVVSTYELIHLAIFILFATSSVKETNEITHSIFEATNFDIQELRYARDLFCENKYAEFVFNLHLLEKKFKTSKYTSPSKKLLTEAIMQNLLVHYLYPLAKASFQTLHDIFGLNNETITFYIKKSIREGKLNGKLDLVTNQYISSVDFGNNQRKMIKILNDTIEIRHDFEISQWIDEYNSVKAPHAKK